MKRLGPVFLLCTLGCARMDAPRLEPRIEVGPTHRAGPIMVRADARPLKALYVMPTEVAGIGLESGPVSVVDAVVVLDDRGELQVADLVHEANPPATYRRGKLDLRDVVLKSEHGKFVGKGRRFVPKRDPLATIDSGFVVQVGVGGFVDRVVFTPLYDADLYSPFLGLGEAGPVGRIGVVGKSGRGGADGEDGEDGSDGLPGQAGTDGTAGTNGTKGKGAKGGRPGARGIDGAPGPDLDVQIRPIYSKFYPDEELVFIEVASRFRDRRGSVISRGKQRYIIHPRQRFRITSRGGDGGAGGAGGRGGHGGAGGRGGDGGDGGDGGSGTDNRNGAGGNGGNGGAGGNGGDGGNGGNGASGGIGGLGGNGGDGGRIQVRVLGSRAFRGAARRDIVVRSEAGAAGAAGAGGLGGNPGAGGRKGEGGDGGKGGRGGSGRPSGKSGVDGKDGEDGSSGDNGKRGRRGKPGRAGRAGRPQAVTWR